MAKAAKKVTVMADGTIDIGGETDRTKWSVSDWEAYYRDRGLSGYGLVKAANRSYLWCDGKKFRGVLAWVGAGLFIASAITAAFVGGYEPARNASRNALEASEATVAELQDDVNSANAGKTQAEKDKAQAEADKAQAEKDKAQAEKDKAQAEADKAQAEKDKAQAEKDKAQAEADKARVEADKAQAEADKVQAEADKTQAEADKAQAEKERDEALAGKTQAEEERDALLNQSLVLSESEEQELYSMAKGFIGNKGGKIGEVAGYGIDNNGKFTIGFHSRLSGCDAITYMSFTVPEVGKYDTQEEFNKAYMLALKAQAESTKKSEQPEMGVALDSTQITSYYNLTGTTADVINEAASIMVGSRKEALNKQNADAITEAIAEARTAEAYTADAIDASSKIYLSISESRVNGMTVLDVKTVSVALDGTIEVNKAGANPIGSYKTVADEVNAAVTAVAGSKVMGQARQAVEAKLATQTKNEEPEA